MSTAQTSAEIEATVTGSTLSLSSNKESPDDDIVSNFSIFSSSTSSASELPAWSQAGLYGWADVCVMNQGHKE